MVSLLNKPLSLSSYNYISMNSLSHRVRLCNDYTCGSVGTKSLSPQLEINSIAVGYKSCYKQVIRSKYDCLLFDLDDTLYPFSSGLAAACCNNIEDFMVYKLGINSNVTSKLGDLLYKNYGTTIAGLKAIGYDFCNEEYFSFVHGRLPYEKLKPDPILRSLLLSLPVRKVIFTNADKAHADKTLEILGIKDCFEEIICFETLNPINIRPLSDNEDDIQMTASKSSTTITESSKYFDIISHFTRDNTSASLLPNTPIFCKPYRHAIVKALKIGNINPRKTLFFEDSIRSIQSGKLVGLDTVLVGTSKRITEADYVVKSIHDIRDELPELWKCL